MTQIIENLAEVSAKYDALFVDLWGCVHDGVAPIPSAVEALINYRKGGGAVCLVTNAPRHRAAVAKQLEHIGVSPESWDTIATSGDSARAAMFRGAVGKKVWFIGEPHDQSFFDPIAVVENPVEITQVELAEADGIVCTGPFDPQADPSVNRPAFLLAKTRGLPLLCANPDIVVDRGDKREWCAGALARLYTEMGGQSHYFGKPHPPIYDLAHRRLAELGKDAHSSRILAIGDGIHTDVQGAMGEDIDCLFITGGLAAKETGTKHQPDAALLDAYLLQAKLEPRYSIGFLR